MLFSLRRCEMIRFLYNRFEEVLGSVLLAVMVAVAFINVVVRYCTTYSFAWSEELTVNFFVWIVLLGTTREFREGGHLGMHIFYNALTRRLRQGCYVLGVCACLLFFSALCVLGTWEVWDEMILQVTSESLGIPVWCYTIATPLFSLLIMFRILQRCYDDMRIGRY